MDGHSLSLKPGSAVTEHLAPLREQLARIACGARHLGGLRELHASLHAFRAIVREMELKNLLDALARLFRGPNTRGAP